MKKGRWTICPTLDKSVFMMNHIFHHNSSIVKPTKNQKKEKRYLLLICYQFCHVWWCWITFKHLKRKKRKKRKRNRIKNIKMDYLNSYITINKFFEVFLQIKNESVYILFTVWFFNYLHYINIHILSVII